jgi:hypothetical protein
MDKSSKILLGLIAAGLWANATVAVLKITPARADAESYLSSINTYIALIANGRCSNSKLC